MGKNVLQKELDEFQKRKIEKNAKSSLCLIFATRLRECFLMNPDINQEELAKKSRCSPGSVSTYLKGEREPKAEIVAKFAQIFNVSTDYLLGLTNTPTTQTDLRGVCDYTGLNQTAVDNLKNSSSMDLFIGNTHLLKMTNELLSTVEGTNILETMWYYLFAEFETDPLCEKYGNKIKDFVSFLIKTDDPNMHATMTFNTERIKSIFFPELQEKMILWKQSIQSRRDRK